MDTLTRHMIGFFLGVIAGAIGGWMSVVNGFSAPWQQLAVCGIMFCLLAAVFVVSRSPHPPDWEPRLDKNGEIYMWVRPLRAVTQIVNWE